MKRETNIPVIEVTFKGIYLLLIFAWIGCKENTSSKRGNDEIIEISNIIDLTEGFKNIHSVRLSEIVDSITFIPFVTNSQSLMGSAQKRMEFNPQFIFYNNIVFDWEGNYLVSIGRRGNGTFEEPQGVFSVVYKENHFYSKGSKFIEYEMNGKPTGKVRNLYASNEFSSTDFLRSGSLFIAGDNLAVYNYPTTVYFFNTDFQTVSSRVVTNADSLPPYLNQIGDSKFVTYFNDKVLFYNFMNDTIFYVSDTVMESKWIVNFDEKLRLSTQVMLNFRNLMNDYAIERAGGLSYENTKLVQLTNNKHKVVAVYETESYIFFHMIEIALFAEPRGLTQPLPYIIYYDKKTGKSIRVEGNGFEDDLLDMDYFFPQLGIYDSKLISFIWPFELLDYIEKCKETGRKVNPRLIELSKKIDSEDNPILILAHIIDNRHIIAPHTHL